jgi:site-specific recombinase XerD
MKTELDIYNLDRRLELAKLRYQKLTKIKFNKEKMHEFLEHLAVTGISKSRILKYLALFVDMEKCLAKSFDKIDVKDIKSYIVYMQGKKMSQWTIYTHLVAIKRFYKWLKGNDEFYPDEVKWIKPRLNKSEMKPISDGDLLTEAEVKKMIKQASNTRDKAFVSLLFESGCRIGEIASLQIKNVKVDNNGVVLSVQGKTGARPVRVITSTPYVMSWLENHPLRDDHNAPLWVAINQSNRNQPMHYRGLVKVIKDIKEELGIKKKCNPHLFRHSRATQLASHLTEFQMDKYFGWIFGSKMPSTYVHLSGRDLDASLLEFNGIKVPEKKEIGIKPKLCPKCNTINTYDAKFCNNCAGILDIEAAMFVDERNKSMQEMNQIMADLAKNPELMQKFISALQGLGKA